MKRGITNYEIALDILTKEKFIGDIPLFNSCEIENYEVNCDGNSMLLMDFIDKYTLRIIEIFKECLYEQ